MQDVYKEGKPQLGPIYIKVKETDVREREREREKESERDYLRRK